MLSPRALKSFMTATRPSDSCSAAELRRRSKTIFYSEELPLPARPATKSLTRWPTSSVILGREIRCCQPADFKTPVNRHCRCGPERRFMGMLTDRQNATHIDAWLKEHQLDEFLRAGIRLEERRAPETEANSADFFIKRGEQVSSPGLRTMAR